MSTQAIEIPSRPARNFIGEDFQFSSWEDLKPLYDDLQNRLIGNTGELKK